MEAGGRDTSFEAWARQHVGQANLAGFHGEGGAWVYRHNIVQLMWKCWRASSALSSGESQ